MTETDNPAAPESATMELRLRRGVGKTLFLLLSIFFLVTLLAVGIAAGVMVLSGNLGAGIVALAVFWVPPLFLSGRVARKIDYARDGKAEPIRLDEQALVIPEPFSVRIPRVEIKTGTGYVHSAYRNHQGNWRSVALFLHLRWGDKNLLLLADDSYGDAPARGITRYKTTPSEFELVHVWSQDLLPLFSG